MTKPAEPTGREQTRQQTRQLVRQYARSDLNVDRDQVRGLAKQKIVTTVDQRTAARQESEEQREHAADLAKRMNVGVELVTLYSAHKIASGFYHKFDDQLTIGTQLKKTWDLITGRDFMKITGFDQLGHYLRGKEIDKQVARLTQLRDNALGWEERIAEMTDKLHRAKPDEIENVKRKATELADSWYGQTSARFKQSVAAWETFSAVAATVDFEVQAGAIKAWASESGQTHNIEDVHKTLDLAASWIQPFVASNRLTGVIFRAYSNASAAAKVAEKNIKLEHAVRDYRAAHALSEVMAEMDNNPLAIARRVLDTRNDVLALSILTIQNLVSAGLAASPPGVYELVMPLSDFASTLIQKIYSSYFDEQIKVAGKKWEEVHKRTIGKTTVEPSVAEEVLAAFGVPAFKEKLKSGLKSGLSAFTDDPKKAAKILGKIAEKTIAPDSAGGAVGALVSTDETTGVVGSSLDTSGIAKAGGGLAYAGSVLGVINWVVDKITEPVMKVVYKEIGRASCRERV